MTNPDLLALVEEAEKLLVGITPGEWSQHGQLFTHAINAETPSGWVKVVGGDHDCDDRCGIVRYDDAEFIAAAPRLIRSLLVELGPPPRGTETDVTRMDSLT